jgi:Tfp pilus assembly protein PilV
MGGFVIRRRPGRAAERGLTLIEMLISMVLLLFALLAMLAVVPFGFSSVETSSIQVQAVAIGQQYLEDERNALLQAGLMPASATTPIYAGESFTNDGKADTNYGNFSVTPDGCTTVIDPSSLSGVNVYQCSVTVSWRQSLVTRSVTVQSYVAK